MTHRSTSAVASLKGAKPAELPVVRASRHACDAGRRSLPRERAWLHEIKFDGYRLQARLEPVDACRLLTRTGLDWTDRFGKR
jgi:bifunctional non-homologous end joining protein LigD